MKQCHYAPAERPVRYLMNLKQTICEVKLVTDFKHFSHVRNIGEYQAVVLMWNTVAPYLDRAVVI